MAKKKTTKKLTAIPPRDDTPPKPHRASAAAAADAGPDLSKIVEALRPLAVPVGDLLFDPANARTHDEKNLDAIRGSLAVYGQRKPIVVNRRTNHVEAGNGTLQAALSLGWSHVAVVYVDDDSATAAGYAIADNRTAELADWDKDLLKKAIDESATGCDERLDAMLAELAKDEKLWPDDEPENDDDAGDAPAGGQGGKDELTCPNCGHKWEA